jgi:hypothetical protein
MYRCETAFPPSSPRTYHLMFFCVDHPVASRGIFHYRLYVQTRVRPGRVCDANPFRNHGLGGRTVTCFVFRASIRYWFACPQTHTIMTLDRGRWHFRDKITHTLYCNSHILSSKLLLLSYHYCQDEPDFVFLFFDDPVSPPPFRLNFSFSLGLTSTASTSMWSSRGSGRSPGSP